MQFATEGDILIFYLPISRPKKRVINDQQIDYLYLERETEAYVISHIEKNILFISDLYAKEKGTKKGTLVLKSLCEFVEQNYEGVKYVMLDDSTGVNPPRNIYYKLGFKVRDEVTKNFIKWDTWLTQYKNVANPSEERRIEIKILIKNIKL